MNCFTIHFSSYYYFICDEVMNDEMICKEHKYFNNDESTILTIHLVWRNCKNNY